MNVQFVKQEDKALLQRVFSKGVEIIYEDALNRLVNERELLIKLSSLDNLPKEITSSFLDGILTKKRVEGKKSVAILKNYEKWDPSTPESFFKVFYSRYIKLSKEIAKRPQFKGVVSIAQVFKVRGREEIAVIGMVKDIRKMKDGRKIIELEDPTGTVSVLVSKDIKEASSLVFDDVVGVVGQAGRGIIFADRIAYPDVPFSSDWPKTGSSDVFIISDVHAGSKKFNPEIWEKFVDYINEDKSIKYLIIAGDLVDGIGVYAGQDKELVFQTIEEQYNYFASLLKELRNDLAIFAIPGNHDASRDSEPQPKIPEEFASSIYKIKNLQVLSNPSWISIEGVSFLLYHGTSLDGVIDSIDYLRGVAYRNPSKAQVELLRKRHLSPIFGRNRIFPDEEDFMVIDPIPNVFVTGHLHTASISSYRGIKLISSGTFQERTDFQKKLGHVPTPGKFVRLSLKSGEAKIIDFSSQL